MFAEDMTPLKVYNVKKAVWHTHTLSKDASVLVVENRNTAFYNSPFCPLNSDQRQAIAGMTRAL